MMTLLLLTALWSPPIKHVAPFAGKQPPAKHLHQSLVKPTDSLVGGWIITTEPEHDFCGFKKEFHGSAYQWLLSGPTEKIQITVIGQTSFPNLVGYAKDGKVVLSGYSKKYKTTSYFTLRHKKDHLVGKRYFSGVDKNGYACLAIYRVQGVRQR
ncbi:hypothetical protein KKF91_13865 [Myxococcota bacterium]|nr:hypothetical protein [Myxococcota bacterium]MBU1431625.1 hypothetical protein [Myxococcota bacterium]MBU1900542.1 hypothetical protein [Myxococcota bacterium]